MASRIGGIRVWAEIFSCINLHCARPDGECPTSGCSLDELRVEVDAVAGYTSDTRHMNFRVSDWKRESEVNEPDALCSCSHFRRIVIENDASAGQIDR
ncbi:hypothetical protein D3C74_73690 [compost metagenome]